MQGHQRTLVDQAGELQRAVLLPIHRLSAICLSSSGSHGRRRREHLDAHGFREPFAFRPVRDSRGLLPGCPWRRRLSELGSWRVLT